MMENIDTIYYRMRILLLLNFIVGILFDFSSTLYGWFIRTSLAYPSIGDVALAIWLLATFFILIAMIKATSQKSFTTFTLFLFFILLYGEGIHWVGNSEQLKLWLLGFNDHLGLGTAPHTMLINIDPKLLPLFKLIYFYDEYLGHFLLFSAYFSLFLYIYHHSFTRDPYDKYLQNKINKKNGLTIFVIFSNSLYMSWNIIEGQSTILYLVVFSLFVIIKIYNQAKHKVTIPYARLFEYIFSLNLVWIVLWFIFIGNFSAMPQFFVTMKDLVGI